MYIYIYIYIFLGDEVGFTKEALLQLHEILPLNASCCVAVHKESLTERERAQRSSGEVDEKIASITQP